MVETKCAWGPNGPGLKSQLLYLLSGLGKLTSHLGTSVYSSVNGFSVANEVVSRHSESQTFSGYPENASSLPPPPIPEQLCDLGQITQPF